MESRDDDLDARDDRERTVGTELVLFGVKALIVAIVFVVSVLFLVSRIESKITQFAESNTGPAFWKKVEAEIDRAADPRRGLPPEKKQELLQKLRAISVQWRPFVTEAYAILISNEPVSAVPPDK